MSSTPLAALALLRAAAGDGRLDALAERQGIALLTVFGSTARGAADAHDLDVAVLPRAGRVLDVLALIDDLTVLTGSNDVDLLRLDRAGPVARERALVGCVPLYQHEPGVYGRAQMAAMTERMDTDRLRRAALEDLAR